MRVVAMVHLFPPRHNAGAEVMLVNLLRPLVKRGHTVEAVLSRQDGGSTEPYEYDGITVRPRVDDPQPYVRTADFVITHLENTPRAVALCKGYARPLAILCHNTFDQTRKQIDNAAGLPGAVVFNSHWMRAELGNRTNGLVVRPPVDATDYATTPGDRVTLVNLSPTKGGNLFWSLAQRMPDVKFLAVTGAYGDQVVQALPNVEIVDHIDGRSMRDTVYGQTKILLVPSDYESWGRVGVEAMCSGIPVIAHPTDGLKESLGAAGTFVDRRDEDDWESEIRRLLKPAAWQAASKKAKARARELDPKRDLDAWVAAVERFAR